MPGFHTGKALSELYSNAGLFVLPSYHEGLPIVALEAMSYRLPVLASNIPANEEITVKGELFPVGDVNALAERMNAFISDPNSLCNRGMNPEKLKRLETEFNWERVARKTAEVYEAVLRLPL